MRPNCRWRSAAMPPARSPRSTTWRRWPRWDSVAKPCLRSPRSAASGWPRAAPRPSMAASCRSTVAGWARCCPRRTRPVPRWRCATCSTTCRRGASSCAPNAPRWATSRNGCARWRWPVRTWSCGSATTASPRAATGPVAVTRMRACAWAKPWARISSAPPCVWTTPVPVCGCRAGSPSRTIRVPVPTSSTCTSTAARCAIAASPMR